VDANKLDCALSAVLEQTGYRNKPSLNSQELIDIVNLINKSLADFVNTGSAYNSGDMDDNGNGDGNMGEFNLGGEEEILDVNLDALIMQAEIREEQDNQQGQVTYNIEN